MESSPLILAHDHARAASVATQSSDTTVAINEHALAAGEFARAASGTGSAEALRTLRLLETHHQRLSELLRYPAEYPPSTTSAEQEVKEVAEKPLSTSAAVAELRASKSDLGPRASSPLRTPPGLQHPRRLPPRDLSSSIASNLASARGIRANYARQPLSPSVSTQQAPGSLEALPRRDGKRSQVPASIPEHPQRSWVPPTQGSGAKIPSPTSSRKASIAESTASDEGFSRFYNIFENALSKLSAPLAFAGLPMMSDVGPPALTPEPSANPRYQQSKGRDRTGSDPDLTKYISRAALRASTRDGYSANDSFYVVPTTGHTVSYAHILSFEQKEKQRMAASLHSQNSELCEEEDFVDASETLMPASPNFSRKSSTRKMTGKQLETRFEELDMENKSLKEVIDKMSKRLVSFEMAAQNNTMALQESMRLARNMSPARESSGQEDESLKLRLSDLEESSRLTVKELDKQIKENEKLRNVIARYRERWEKLKEGAKSRATARDGGVLKDHGKDTAKDVNGSGDPDLAPGRLLKA